MNDQHTLPVVPDAQLPAQPSALDTLLADPDRLASFPVDVLERVHVIHKEEREYAARLAFNEAMQAVQQAITPVARKHKNEQTDSYYAKLDDVYEMLLPLLKQHGIRHSISGADSPKGEEWTRFILILVRGGWEETHTLDAPLDYTGLRGAPNKTKMHGMNSTYTQAKKQLLIGTFGVELAEDNDGNRIAGTITESQAADLLAMADEAGLDDGQMAKLYQVLGVTRMEELPESSFQLAWRELERKRRAAGRA